MALFLTFLANLAMAVDPISSMTSVSIASTNLFQSVSNIQALTIAIIYNTVFWLPFVAAYEKVCVFVVQQYDPYLMNASSPGYSQGAETASVVNNAINNLRELRLFRETREVMQQYYRLYR